MMELVNKSIYILRETMAQFKNPAVLWSTGKDSTSVLKLIMMSFHGHVPFPTIHIDTGYKFPEIYEFRDRIANDLNLNLIVAKNKNINISIHPDTHSKLACCNHHKTETLKQIIEEYGFDALVMSIRRDEHYIRNIERYFSPRDMDFVWHIVRPKADGESGDVPFVSEQDAELWNIYRADFGSECSHVRVHPILHWTEMDVWNFIKDNNLPINPLYFRGYRSIGCEPCTKPTMESSNSVDEIILKLKSTQIRERDGREQDKEDAMRMLRAMGYM